MEEAGDGVAGEVRGPEPDDCLRDAAELRRLSHQRSGRKLLTLIYATTPQALEMKRRCNVLILHLRPEYLLATVSHIANPSPSC